MRTGDAYTVYTKDLVGLVGVDIKDVDINTQCLSLPHNL